MAQTGYKKLRDIILGPESEKHNFTGYLTESALNIFALEARLEEMGLGREFEFIGGGDKAIVVSPRLANDSGKEIVIRISTEYAEPAHFYNQEGKLALRPHIPHVLQALHTEMMPVKCNGRVSTDIRIEVLPRMKKLDLESFWERRKARRYARILEKELRRTGLTMSDLKEDNIGVMPNGKPVILDPGEIKWQGPLMELTDMVADWSIKAERKLKQLLRLTCEWDFEDQTSHLKYDWKTHIQRHLDASRASFAFGPAGEATTAHREREAERPATGRWRD